MHDVPQRCVPSCRMFIFSHLFLYSVSYHLNSYFAPVNLLRQRPRNVLNYDWTFRSTGSLAWRSYSREKPQSGNMFALLGNDILGLPNGDSRLVDSAARVHSLSRFAQAVFRFISTLLLILPYFSEDISMLRSGVYECDSRGTMRMAEFPSCDAGLVRKL